MERHHLTWKVTTLCRCSSFKGIFVHLNDVILRNLFIKVVVLWVIFPTQLESLNLEVCRGNYGQNTKTVQSEKVTSLWLGTTVPTRHSQPLSWVGRLCRLGTCLKFPHLVLLVFFHSNALRCYFNNKISLKWPIKHKLHQSTKITIKLM